MPTNNRCGRSTTIHSLEAEQETWRVVSQLNTSMKGIGIQLLHNVPNNEGIGTGHRIKDLVTIDCKPRHESSIPALKSASNDDSSGGFQGLTPPAY